MSQYGDRDYQIEAVDSVYREWDRGIRSTLVVLPCGLGKTVVASRVVERLPSDRRVLFIAHREELVLQTREKMQAVTGRRVALECGQDYKGYRTDPTAPIVVATEQSLVRRLGKYKPDHFSVMVDDESHLSTTPTRSKIRSHFTGIKNMVGLTATPRRHDGEALGKVFDTVSFERDIQWAVESGWLTPIRNRVVSCKDMDLRKVKLTAGEFDRKQLEKVLVNQSLVDQIAYRTTEIADGRQTIIFCHSVAQAKAVHSRLQASGERSIYIDGETDRFIRRNSIKKYNAGESQFLVNVGVATTGFDSPTVGVVAMARPTRSQVLMVQCCGRGLRPIVPPQTATPEERRREIAASKKTHCTIIDFVGQMGENAMRFSGDLLGGNYDDDVRKLAMRIAGGIVGDIDMAAVIAEAEETIKKRRDRQTQRERDAQQQKLSAQGNRKAEMTFYAIHKDKLDPYKVLGLDRKDAATLPADQAYGKTIEQARQMLYDAGVTDYEMRVMTALEQVYLARAIYRRGQQNLASWKQCKIVYLRGYRCENMSKRQASVLIDRIASNDNKWCRPWEDGENPLFVAWLTRQNARSGVTADSNTQTG